MIEIIMDTDIGVDCDDAAALALLLNMQRRGKCKILAVTACTTRVGSAAAIRTVCDYYGFGDIPVARYAGKPLECDKENYYAKTVMDKYGYSDATGDAVKLLRKTLAEASGKITLIGIGPLVNIAELMRSGADEFSPLGGIELMREKVSEFYLMAGSFEQNRGSIDAEWNVLQDIDSARYVADNCPCKMIYSPFEYGNGVYTFAGEGKNPVWFSMHAYAKALNFDIGSVPVLCRMSWDPVTCMLPFSEFADLFEYSEWGIITVNKNGSTEFRSCPSGQHKFLCVNDGMKNTETALNSLIERID